MITTTTPYDLLPGQTALKRIDGDGHHYGRVARVERLTNRSYVWRDNYRIDFEDGSSKEVNGGETIILKDR